MPSSNLRIGSQPVLQISLKHFGGLIYFKDIWEGGELNKDVGLMWEGGGLIQFSKLKENGISSP